MTLRQVHSTIDLSAPGKQLGHLCVPKPGESPATNYLLPICSIAGGEGPTVLAIAGNRSQAFAGRVAILRLIESLAAEQVRGRLILIPGLQISLEHTPTAPADPDEERASRQIVSADTSSEMLARFLVGVLLPLSDAIINIRSPGPNLAFYPCAHLYPVSDVKGRQAAVAAALSWNTDFVFVESIGGPLALAAQEQQKTLLEVEMSGEPVSAAIHQLTQSALSNALVHFGLLSGRRTTRVEAQLPPTRWVQASSRDDYRFAPQSGIYESRLELGAVVSAGETLGLIHFPDDLSRTPQPVVAHAEGVLLATRSTSEVVQGDAVACIAHDFDPAELA